MAKPGLVITPVLDIYIFTRGAEGSIRGDLHLLARPATRSGPYGLGTSS